MGSNHLRGERVPAVGTTQGFRQHPLPQPSPAPSPSALGILSLQPQSFLPVSLVTRSSLSGWLRDLGVCLPSQPASVCLRRSQGRTHRTLSPTPSRQHPQIRHQIQTVCITCQHLGPRTPRGLCRDQPFQPQSHQEETRRRPNHGAPLSGAPSNPELQEACRGD